MDYGTAQSLLVCWEDTTLLYSLQWYVQQTATDYVFNIILRQNQFIIILFVNTLSFLYVKTGYCRYDYIILGGKGRSTPADVWSIWRDSDEVRNKYVQRVQRVQLRWKLLEPLGRCLLRFSMWSRLSAVWAIRFSDWRCASECVWGRILRVHWFSTHSVPSFLFFMFCSTGMTKAVIMSTQDKLICVRLVMPRCMFSMQLFLSDIVKFRFDWKLCA